MNELEKKLKALARVKPDELARLINAAAPAFGPQRMADVRLTLQELRHRRGNALVAAPTDDTAPYWGRELDMAAESLCALGQLSAASRVAASPELARELQTATRLMRRAFKPGASQTCECACEFAPLRGVFFPARKEFYHFGKCGGCRKLFLRPNP